MTQFQLDLICKVIKSGAPALADELCGSLDVLVQSYNAVVAENAQLRNQLAAEDEVRAETDEQPN